MGLDSVDSVELRNIKTQRTGYVLLIRGVKDQFHAQNLFYTTLKLRYVKQPKRTKKWLLRAILYFTPSIDNDLAYTVPLSERPYNQPDPETMSSALPQAYRGANEQLLRRVSSVNDTLQLGN